MAFKSLLSSNVAASGGINQLTAANMEEMEEAFSLFDIDGDGYISLQELVSVIKSVGRECLEEDSHDIMKIIDADGDGKMGFDEFVDTMKDRMQTGLQEEDLREAFNVFDSDQNGFISAYELQQGFRSLGEIITEEEATDLLSQADSNDDGLLDFEEFEAFYKAKEQ